MRLIDADALCMHLSDWQFGSMTDGKHDAEYSVLDKVIDGIEKEQTVDAVEVVRCKDCEFFRRFAEKAFEQATEEHRAICKDCPDRKYFAKVFDMHFYWVDCWFDCENDYEHHQAEEAKKGEANES